MPFARNATVSVLTAAAVASTLLLSGTTDAAAKQCGAASWYGPGFHGRTTANGEKFNQNAMTAAHKGLRFGSRVRVTNQINGKSMTLRINDRGHYANGRIIDVSKAAAAALGFQRRGHAPVCVSVLG